MKSRRTFLKETLALCAAPHIGGCLSRPDGGVLFVMFNDVHENAEYFARLSAAGPGKSDFCVFAGDMLNDVRDSGCIRRSLLDPLGKARSRFGAPVHFVRGNRELRGEAAPGLWRHLGYREAVDYRARTVKGVRFVFLDTCESRPPSKGARDCGAYLKAEKSWLEREIASGEWRSAKARIVFMHIPPPVKNVDSTSSQRVPVLRPTKVPEVLALQDTLLDSGVTAVFAGHIHMGSFDLPTDVRPYPVIVGGGSRLDPVYPVEPLLTVCNLTDRGFVVRQVALDGAVRREMEFPA
jgi:3',5'-cyclic AMP phosphodiesterase CpdA